MTKKKNTKPLLQEATIRRMMKLAKIPELSESFFNEKQGYDDEEDESLGMRTGKEADKEQSDKDRRDDAGFEVRKEEDELEATEDELGAEDEVADEEGAELDAEAAEGEAEITPEQAAAVVELAPVIADLAASLEAGGAVEGDEVEVEAEIEDVGGDEVEAEEEVEEIEESLVKLGIQVVDDRTINETVRKRVVARLLKEKRAQDKERTVNKLVDNIFARLQKRSK